MLRIRIDGQDVETTPTLLAKLVWDGKVDQRCPTWVPGAMAEQPLEQSLGLPHCEALTAELHRRLQLMCSMDSTAVDVQELCTRVEGLCQWRWVNAPVAARFFWAAGWLNELADHTKNAVEFYDAFLLMPSADSHLRLLALNNRGVLCIQLGRLEGLHDLAQAAIADGGLKKTQDADPPQTGLPAACFNLLNLINVAFGVPGLLRAIDEELGHFFAGLPHDLTTLWLGPLDGVPDADRAGSVAGGWDEACEANPPSAVRRPQFGDLPILRDPTYRRLNLLVTRLSAQARGLLPDSHRLPGHAAAVFRQLSLWDCRLNGAPPGRDEAAPKAGHPAPDQHQRYAEAASLLLSDDIPSVLARPENPLVRMEQSVREELAVIEGYVAAGQYEPARLRLHVQRKLLLSLNARGPLAAALARVEAQLETVTTLEAQAGQLEFQQVCAGFAAEVQEFCAIADIHQAQNRLADLQRRLQQFQVESAPQNGAEAVGLVEELGTRLQRHLDGLRQVLADLEARTQALPQEAAPQMRGPEIVEETEKVRVAVAGRSESGLCQARPDEPAAKEKERGLLAQSWRGRHPRPAQDETGSARKEA